tara:strand:- start:1151 stop:1624 length:474 start_codon:yes stop_codon:yes gene_type:complete
MKNKLFLNSLIVLSFLSLSFAYFVEFVLGHEPCNLCKIERIPYIGAIILGSLIIFINKWEKTILILILLLFIFGTLTSIYHVGIEQGFFEESLICDLGTNNEIQNTEELLKTLKNTTVSCKEVTFRILGLSLATFNAVLSFFISVIVLGILRKNEQN